jgi:tetratricopeptide (TPR) repeat protein
VIGGEFSYDLLRAVHPIAEEDLQRALRKLADAEMLYVRGIAPDANYQFKHALIRDAAYEALLKSRRRDLHRLVARAIDEKFVAISETHPEVLARHWTEAGETEPAIAEWSRAGKAMETRSAFREALESYQQALALLSLLPDSPGRDSRELELRQFVHGMLWLTKGPSEGETLVAAERAAALAEKSGNVAQLIKSIITRGNIALDSGDLFAARRLADDALGLALREASPASLGMAHDLQIATRHYQGDLAGAENYFILGLKVPSSAEFGHTPGIVMPAPERYWQIIKRFGFASWNAWMLGRADVARERMARAMAAVNRDGNPFDLAHSGYFAARLYIYLREYEQVESLEAQTLELAEKHQFQILAALSRVGLGQARAHLGRAAEGIALIRRGIAAMIEIGSRSGVTRVTATLAEAQEREGSIVEALETIEQALQVNSSELVYRPETLRLQGELRIKLGQIDLAEAGFREAIALAQKIGAKAWELRATMSLARLLNEQGRRDEARVMLAEIYGWFTEGFDTADLKDAKSLLEQSEA